MKSFFLSIKNLTPYLLLVAIYFFFINIEAKKNNNNLIEIEKSNNLTESNIKNKDSAINIPVIPFKD
tara:strand:- start:212 stop:412 length:201 start_codon:yes stop_codon:yes gene_type:complete